MSQVPSLIHVVFPMCVRVPVAQSCATLQPRRL